MEKSTGSLFHTARHTAYYLNNGIGSALGIGRYTKIQVSVTGLKKSDRCIPILNNVLFTIHLKLFYTHTEYVLRLKQPNKTTGKWLNLKVQKETKYETCSKNGLNQITYMYR